ncbi:MAG: RNA polymerase sigma factor [Planctomycetota bacterium]
MTYVVTFGDSASALSDDDLMQALGRGDEGGLAELIRRHQSSLVGYLTGIVNDAERARDLSQETFLRVFRHAAGYRTSSRFTTWLYHIARNVARDELRTRKRRPQLCTGSEQGLLEAPSSAPAVADRVAQREAVLAALSGLSERDRKLIVMRDLEARSYEEIAEATGMCLGTVKSGLSRARARFAARFAGL